MHKSLLHYYSLAIVAENANVGDKEISVLPIEIFPYFDGELKEEKGVELHKGVDAANKPYTVKVKTRKTIPALWWQFASTHRDTAPNVRRGERVLLWQYADTDEYRWASLGEDDGLRRLETILWLFSGTKDENVTKLTTKNSYSAYVSTHDKVIRILTTKEDGEPYAYTIEIETKSGKVTIKDDIGNEFFLVSAKNQWCAINKDKSKMEIIGTIMNLETSNEINIKTKTLNVEATTLNQKTSTTNITTSTVNEKTSSYNATIGSYAFSGGSISHDGKKIDKTHKHTSTAPGTPTSPPL
jgi:hypothetical protein